MELHGHTPEPITIVLIRPAELDLYRAELAKSNPDTRYAVLGQLAVMYANRIFQDVAVSQSPWTYNASENTYSRA
jgi:hypothetical protein